MALRVVPMVRVWVLVAGRRRRDVSDVRWAPRRGPGEGCTLWEALAGLSDSRLCGNDFLYGTGEPCSNDCIHGSDCV